MLFGDILQELLEKREMTQKQLAEHLNVAPSTISNYVQYSREPDFETLRQLADFFDVSIDYLLDHRTKKANDRSEDELLAAYRSMTPEQQRIYLEQGKVVVWLNSKKGK